MSQCGPYWGGPWSHQSTDLPSLSFFNQNRKRGQVCRLMTSVRPSSTDHCQLWEKCIWKESSSPDPGVINESVLVTECPRGHSTLYELLCTIYYRPIHVETNMSPLTWVTNLTHYSMEMNKRDGHFVKGDTLSWGTPKFFTPGTIVSVMTP